MDGLTCVRRIRELQQEGVVRGHVPVIAVTANVRSEQVKVAMEAGMDDVISKPFRIPELCACIQKTLGRLGGG
jgi:CheY-like chemotaxis protein